METDRDRDGGRDWWGVVLDTDDVGTLTRFYAALHGWRIRYLDRPAGSPPPGR